jgi:hypothetical protein
MNEVKSILDQINNLFEQENKRNRVLSEKNNNYYKILATVKNDLERAIKNPSNLLDVVCNCVDLLRANTPYYSTDLGGNKIDPPLTDEEKENFKQKINN